MKLKDILNFITVKFCNIFVSKDTKEEDVKEILKKLYNVTDSVKVMMNRKDNSKFILVYSFFFINEKYLELFKENTKKTV